jgi:hypothetical protein
MTSRTNALRYPEGTKTVGTARVREDKTVGRSYAERELMRRTGNAPHSTFDEVADGVGAPAIAKSVAASAKTASEIGGAVALGNEIKRLLKQVKPKKPAGPKRKSKYGNVKHEHDGMIFDSGRELARYKALRARELAGEIRNLRMQVPFLLIGKQKRSDGKAERECSYIADFAYEVVATSRTEVEDVKSEPTRKKPEYVMKRKLMLERHGITIKEVK